MKALIENYRGIKSAEFEIGGITLIAAKNASGKSSIAQAVSACLNANPVPVPGMTKAQIGFLVRSGAMSGTAQLMLDDDNGVRIDWPKATVGTIGANPPSASPYAVGADSVADLSETKRASMLTDLLMAYPTEPDLAQAVKQAKLDDKLTGMLWERIQQVGWDQAFIQAKDKGVKLKGQWELYAGERYGAKKAESWLPQSWDAATMNEGNRDTLVSELAKATEELEAAIASQAVDQSRVEQATALSSNIQSLTDKIAALNVELKDTIAAKEQAMQNLQNAPHIPTLEHALACPECGVLLKLTGNQLTTTAGGPTQEMIDEAKSVRDELRKLADTANNLESSIRSEIAVETNNLQQAQNANAWLSSVTKTDVSGITTPEDIDRARVRQADAQTQLEYLDKKLGADKTHHQIENNQIIIDLLSPNGLRQNVLYAKVREFMTTWVKPLTFAANWHDVELDREMVLSYGGRLYSMLSESEKYRAKAALQVGMAMFLGDKVVVLDAADILDKEGRNGLIKMLMKSALSSLVCMTMPSKEEAPDLSRNGIGRTYWVEDGAVTLATKS